jgi:hypothetical protein
MDQSSLEFGCHQLLSVQIMDVEERLISEGSSLGSNKAMCISALRAVRSG